MGCISINKTVFKFNKYLIANKILFAKKKSKFSKGKNHFPSQSFCQQTNSRLFFFPFLLTKTLTRNGWRAPLASPKKNSTRNVHNVCKKALSSLLRFICEIFGTKTFTIQKNTMKEGLPHKKRPKAKNRNTV